MSDFVLDASAVLALLQGEPGSEAVVPMLPSAALGTVNAAEVISKLADAGMPAGEARRAVLALGVDVLPFDLDLAEATGALRPTTSSAGLSLGDRACLALARRLGAEAVTTDEAWARLRGDVRVRVLRARPGRR